MELKLNPTKSENCPPPFTQFLTAVALFEENGLVKLSVDTSKVNFFNDPAENRARGEDGTKERAKKSNKMQINSINRNNVRT